MSDTKSWINTKLFYKLLKDLDPSAYRRFVILMYLSKSSLLHGGYIYETGDSIAKITGFNKKTVQRILADFEEKKVIARVAPGVWQYVGEIPEWLKNPEYF